MTGVGQPDGNTLDAGLAPGRYTVTASKGGYAPDSLKLRIK